MTIREDAATTVTRDGPSARRRADAFLKLIRVRQWVKNGFVLAGLFFSDQLFRETTAAHSVAAFVAFCFLSGAVYTFNDILDREADAKHPDKQNRPLVTGAVTVREATFTGITLAALAALVLAVVRFPWPVYAILASYAVINVAYSIWLKHISLLDIVVIASGFVLRLEAGIFAVRVKPSSWIVLCTGLLSIFLALAKRRGDLTREAVSDRRSLSGYTIAYIDQALSMMGAATIVVYAIFTVSAYAQLRFHAPLLYLTAFPVAIGILRYLQITIVEGRYASPADVVLHDRPLQLVILTWVALFFAFVYA